MKNNDSLLVAIADQSIIIRSGMLTTLKRIPKLNIQVVELANSADLEDCLQTQPVDILIVNPFFEGYFNLDIFLAKLNNNEYAENKKIKLVALNTSLVDPSLLLKYDAKINLFDTLSFIGEVIYTLSNADDSNDDDQESLSEREKEVVVCVVKGMTNKEIAEHLFLSIHTVNTHRKNISKKLQIHSASGLTIYAIVNNLVDINEIKADL